MSNGLSGVDLMGVLPMVLLVLGGITCLFLEVFQRPSRPRTYIAPVAATAFALAGWLALRLATVDATWTFHGTAVLDSYGALMTAILCMGGVLTSLMAPAYLARSGVDRGEFYALLLFAGAGMSIMVSSSDLMVIFLGLEIQSVCAYALAGYLRGSSTSAEAGIKYFIMGAVASAVFLYGAAMLYGATGSTFLPAIAESLHAQSGLSPSAAADRALHGVLAAAQGVDPAGLAAQWGHRGSAVPLPAIGALLVLLAFASKIALFPFHGWAPDAYSGAPTAASGFLAATVKAAGVATLARILFTALWGPEARFGEFGWTEVVMWLSLLSMVVGNLTALLQTSIKRMLAWSSVAHAGYMFAALAAAGAPGGSPDVVASIVLHTFAYTLSTVGAFGLLAWFHRDGLDVEHVEDLNDLAASHPWAAGSMAVFMLSAAGFPGTAGFISKFWLFSSVAGAAHGEYTSAFVILVVVGLLSSVVGAAYYFRLIVHMYGRRARREISADGLPMSRLAIIVAAVLTVWFGLVPGQMSDLATDAAASMLGRADGGYESPSDRGETP
jgi:NADH-quinone oxidoreductase subunit N